MFKKFRFYLKNEKKSITSTQPKQKVDCISHTIHTDLDSNMKIVKERLGTNDDIVFREFQGFVLKPIKIFICYMSGLVDDKYIGHNILKPLMEANFTNEHMLEPFENVLQIVKDNILNVSSLNEIQSMQDALYGVLSGQTVVFIHGCDTALSIETQGFESRSVTEPDTEVTVRGPREGFTENIEVNTALIRRKIINPNLTFEKLTLGKETHTKIRIGYIKGVANPKVIEEVKERLKRIELDSILESGYIEQLIEDHPYSLFATIGNSEKPDLVAAKMLEGRVAILCNGTPFVLTVPHLFIENIQVSEDHYSRPYLSSLMRLLRIVSLFLTINIPAIYVALTSYHQAMIPSILVTKIASAEEKVPFPVILEVIMIGVAFELLREAGIRMPRAVGSATTIVGTLIIGQAAVEAGFLSAPIVIIMAFTGISGMVIPPLNDIIVFSRLVLVFLAGVLGFYGILIGSILFIAHMTSLQSFGSSYLAPLAPTIWGDWKDVIIRAPLQLTKKKP